MNPQPTPSTGSNGLRVEILAARISSAEMQEVEAAAQAGGITRSEWLRNAIFEYLQRPHQSPEISFQSAILEEIMGLRYLLLNLSARANPGLGLQTLLGVMAAADEGKSAAAARVLARPGENSTPA